MGRSRPPEGFTSTQPDNSIKPFTIFAGQSATTSRLITDILEGLGDELRRPAFHAVEVRRAGSMLRENGYEILLIDDADDLLDQKEFESGGEEGEFHMSLADFLSMLAMPFVLVGRDGFEDRANEKDTWYGRSIAAVAKLNDPLKVAAFAAA